MPNKKITLPTPTYKVIMGPVPFVKNYSVALEDALDVMYHESQKPNRHTASRLSDLIKKYPRTPQFKNYLYSVYTLLKEPKKARDVIHLTVREHPDYFFGKIALAQDFLSDGKWDKVPEVFGGEIFDLEQLFPERSWFHISEVAAMNAVACQYFIAKGEQHVAEAYLDQMADIAPEHKSVTSMTRQLMLSRMSIFAARHKKEKALEQRVESFPKISFDPTNRLPVFHHPEIEALYHHDLNIPQDVVQKILALPRATLLLDLRKCLNDTAQRYDWFRDRDKPFNESEQNFPVHALYLLAELSDPSALPDVLNLLRQGEELLDYWFSDSLFEYFREPVFRLGQQALPDLQSFMLEENIYNFSKTTVAEAVAQIALQDPARRDAVLNWFRAVFQGFLAQPDNDNLIDTSALSWIACQPLNLRATELLPEIRLMYEKQWIMPSVIGALEEVEQEMLKPADPFHVRPFPENIAERYSGENEKRRARSNEMSEAERSNFMKNNSRQLKMMTELFGDKQDTGAPQASNTMPMEKDSPGGAWQGGKNVSRNDLCPCGSGKKFKRCHGK